MVLPTAGTVFDLYSVANRGVFISTNVTCTGSSQSVAHGLGRTPVAVLITVQDNDNQADEVITPGTSTSTNVVFTGTASMIVRILAF